MFYINNLGAKMKKILISLFLSGLVLFGVSFLPDGQGPLYQPSGVNSNFLFKGETFQEYLAYTRELVQTARRKTEGADDSEEVVLGNASSEIVPANVIPGKEKKYKDLVVIIHSLTGSPYEMKELSKYYASRGMVVRNIMLPGHGTIPGDTVDVQYKDWDAAVEFVLQDSLKIADNVHMAGFSTGGGLSILKSYKYPIKSVMLFAPMIEINSPVAFLLPIVSSVGRVIKKLRWEALEPETNPYKYESMTYSIAAQVYKLQKQIEKVITGEFKQPMFAVLSMEDTTVSSDTTVAFFKNTTNVLNRMIIYSKSPKKFHDSRIKTMNFAGFARNINSSSHAGIVTKIDDPYFGLNAPYKICTAYLSDMEKYKKCESLHHTKVVYGEGGPEDGSETILRRITFNPYFDQMTVDLGKFLDSLG